MKLINVNARVNNANVTIKYPFTLKLSNVSDAVIAAAPIRIMHVIPKKNKGLLSKAILIMVEIIFAACNTGFCFEVFFNPL